MIIDFTLDCKNYFQNVFERKMPLDLGHSPYRCAECGARRMIRHGTYERYAVLFNESGILETFPLRIQRLLCTCGRTHALLPGDVIPFHNYNYVPVIDLILLCLYSLVEPCSTMTRKLEDLMLSYQTLRHLLSVYRTYEKGILSVLRVNGWYEQCGTPSSAPVLRILHGLAPPAVQREYFRLFRRPLFLSRRNTVSYPLFFCSADIL